MNRRHIGLAVTGCLALSGCASLKFSDTAPADGNALAFRAAQPYLSVTYSGDCKADVALIAVPGRQRFVSFNSGIGSSELGVSLNSGMITSVTQKTDAQLSPLITALNTAGLFKLDGGGCRVGAALFPIDENGAIDVHHPVILPTLDQLSPH